MVFLFVTAHRFCCLHSRPPQGRGSVRGEPLTGSPTRVQSPPAGDEARSRRCRAATRTRAPKRAPGTFFSLRSCPFEPRPAAYHKKQDHPLGGPVFCVIAHRFCCLHSRPPQGRGSVRGEPLRVPLSRSVTRPRATRLARGAAAPRHAHGHQNVPPARFSRCARALSSLGPQRITKERHPCGCLSFLERATRLELATSTLARSRSTR